MKLQSRYEYDPKLDLLGTGGFARVYRARDTLLDRQVALKVYKGSGPNNYSVLFEIKRAIQLEHPNLLRYHDVVLLEKDDGLGETEQLQIGVMEYANGGDLKAYARAHAGSPMLIKLLKQVLLGLEYLHGKGIIHRDLKAANILLVLDDKGEPTAKISDFGISKDMGAGQQSSSMIVGTIEYMAPEQFSPAKYGIDGKVGTNVDLWAFGVMVHELLLDSTPFGGRDGDTTVEQIMASILSTEQPKDIERLPEPYRSVVKRCLVANAKERIRKAAELIDYLEAAPASKPQAPKAEAETEVYPTLLTAGSTPNATSQAETRVYPGPEAATQPRSAADQEPPHAAKAGRGHRISMLQTAGVLTAISLLVAGSLWYQQDRDRQSLERQAKFEADLKARAQAVFEADSKARTEAERPGRV
jgi:serine/threonine protein kinase